MQKRLGNGIHGSGPAATRLVDPDVGNLIESDICKSSDPGPFFLFFLENRPISIQISDFAYILPYYLLVLMVQFM